MAEAWARTPSIGRSEPPGAVCLAARSAAAYAACLGSGSARKTLVRACIGRLSEPAGTGCARGLWRLAGSCRAEMLRVASAKPDKALGPMLPSSARERWPFCVLRDSCHAAKLDKPRQREHCRFPLQGSLWPRYAVNWLRGVVLVALAATHTPSDLRVIDTVSMQRVLAMLRGRASVSSQVSGPFPPCLTENGPVLRCFCAFACLQVMY